MAYGDLGSSLVAGFQAGSNVAAKKQEMEAKRQKAFQEQIDRIVSGTTDSIAKMYGAALTPENADQYRGMASQFAQDSLQTLDMAFKSGQLQQTEYVIRKAQIETALKSPLAFESEQAKIANKAAETKATTTAEIGAKKEAGALGTGTTGTAMLTDGRQVGAQYNSTTGQFMDLQGNPLGNVSRFLPQSQTAQDQTQAGFGKGMSTIANQFTEQEASLRTVISIGENTIDLIEREDTVIGALGGAMQGLNSVLEQTKNTARLFLDNGRPVVAVVDDTQTQDGGGIYDNYDRFDFGKLSQVAVNNAEVRANLLTIAALNARAFEPGARQLSDADIQRQLTILGSGGSKQVMINNLKSMIANSITAYENKVKAFNSIAPSMGDGIQPIRLADDLVGKKRELRPDAKTTPLDQKKPVQGTELPPMEGAVKDAKGRWVIKQNGKWYEVRP